MTKKLMYSFGDQQVWLIWELKDNRPMLACICTTNEDLSRYVTSDRKSWIGREGAVVCEKVICDHLYGAHDSSIMMRLLRLTT